MSDGIVLRLAVDSDTLGAVLDRLPGVAVVDDLADPTAADTTDETDDGDPPTDDGEPGRLATLVGEWGLLGLGVGFVALGVATVALWWTRRGDDAEPEIEPGGADERVSTVLEERSDDGESVADTPVPAGADDEHTVDRGPPAPEPTTDPGEHTDSSGGTDGDAVAGTADRAREEGDSDDSAAADAASSDVADERGLEDGRAGGERAPDERESEDDADVLRRGDIDPAPLVGAAFLAVVGVVVRWLGGDQHSD